MMKMTMTNEFISPEKAKQMLEFNSQNRNISRGTVEAYAKDILAGNWDERVGSAISIDENGILRDGQHRLMAIIRAKVGVRMWVCRNVSSNGVYDCNRKRNNSDQVHILRPEWENVYRSNKYIAVVRAIIEHNTWGSTRRRITPKEIVDFTEKHKNDLDGFFKVFPQTTVPKISIATVHLALYMAYLSGVDIDRILSFYEILCFGMSTKPEEFPVIALRNYLKDHQVTRQSTEELSRVQYALKKYLTGSCTKKSISLKDLIYPFPYDERNKTENKNGGHHE